MNSTLPAEQHKRANTDWFCDAKWGLFVHYLADVASALTPTDLPVDDWNRRIDAYDVDGFAAQLAEVQAGYCFITLGQNSGYYISPNAAYDAIVPRRPSRCAQRDLVADLSAALARYNIPLMVYFSCSAPAHDRVAIEALKCTPPWDPRPLGFEPGSFTVQPGVDDRLTEFQQNWEAIIREWSVRWGNTVRGWWFDGCYCADQLYRHPDAPNFASFAAAAKAGNAESLVAFNPGVKIPVICHTPYEDYTAGEVADSLPAPTACDYLAPLERFVDGAQYHILTFLGTMWGQGEPRFSDGMVAGYTQCINGFGGVVSWDIPTARMGGRISDTYMRQLGVLRDATR